MFTSKDYKRIAEIIANNTTVFGDIDKELLVNDLSEFFVSDNPKFDKVKFEDACYPFRE